MEPEQKKQLELWLYQALAEPIGLLLLAENPKQAKEHLLQARKASLDPELMRVKVRIGQWEDGNIVLFKGAIVGWKPPAAAAAAAPAGRLSLSPNQLAEDLEI